MYFDANAVDKIHFEAEIVDGLKASECSTYRKSTDEQIVLSNVTFQ